MTRLHHTKPLTFDARAVIRSENEPGKAGTIFEVVVVNVQITTILIPRYFALFILCFVRCLLHVRGTEIDIDGHV